MQLFCYRQVFGFLSALLGATPLMALDMKIPLPESSLPQPGPTVLLMLKPGAIWHACGRDISGPADLSPLVKQGKETRIVFLPDQGMAYPDVMTAMQALQSAGYAKVALVVDKAAADQEISRNKGEACAN